MFGGLTYTVRRGLIKGMLRRGGLSWIPEFGTGILTPEQRFLIDLDLSGKVVFDVGAYEGVLTLFFAVSAEQVISYEPNPLSIKALRRNIELNQLENVTVRHVGLGANPRCAVMIWNPAMAGAATVDDTSMAHSIGSRKHAVREEIQITTLDQDMVDARLPVPDLIKIDVDGYELPVLEGAQALLRRANPALFLEMHGETINEKKRNANGIVNFLTAAGYKNILHVETGQSITADRCECAAKGHLYATK
jgi:FkbM family methyltransferase